MLEIIYNMKMRVEAENYGQIVILHARGQVLPQEITQLIQEMVAKCAACSHIVISLSEADLTSQTVAPLIQLREKMRWQKPRIWLASPNLPQADAKSIQEALPLLDSAEANQIVKAYQIRHELARTETKKEEVEERIRTLLGLPEGYKPEDFDAALAGASERSQVAKRQAAATLGHAEALRKGHKGPADSAELTKRLAELKDKAYAATRGDE